MNVLQGLEKLLEVFIKSNVEPDMAMYGKTLGNGYAITVVGKEEVMRAAQNIYQ